MCYGDRSLKPIRSSDIGLYIYCARAWRYRQRGVESSNQGEMISGTELHSQHGRLVLVSGLIRTLGLIALLVGLALLVAYCTGQIL
jgi:hypothetical protein